jgi:hypothetical protein
MVQRVRNIRMLLDAGLSCDEIRQLRTASAATYWGKAAVAAGDVRDAVEAVQAGLDDLPVGGPRSPAAGSARMGPPTLREVVGEVTGRGIEQAL